LVSPTEEPLAVVNVLPMLKMNIAFWLPNPSRVNGPVSSADVSNA
jgi:hypothetical protein